MAPLCGGSPPFSLRLGAACRRPSCNGTVSGAGGDPPGLSGDGPAIIRICSSVFPIADIWPAVPLPESLSALIWSTAAMGSPGRICSAERKRKAWASTAAAAFLPMPAKSRRVSAIPAFLCGKDILGCCVRRPGAACRRIGAIFPVCWKSHVKVLPFSFVRAVLGEGYDMVMPGMNLCIIYRK